jgi:starch synthase (maltosyl-transferring)
MTIQPGMARVFISGVRPEIDCGQYPIKRTVGEEVAVEADIFADGHDELSCLLLHRCQGTSTWQEVPMRLLGNDRWRGAFRVEKEGKHEYTLRGWVNHFASWRRDLKKRLHAGQDVAAEVLVGAHLAEEAAGRAPEAEAAVLREWAQRLRQERPTADKVALALDEEIERVVTRYPAEDRVTTYPKVLTVVVDRERARFSTWYELFPRSCSAEAGRPGTFRDVEARLPYVAGMGFDVLYLPPIHPIGTAFRKGKNNSLLPGPEDPGSPWAIGSPDGGHTAIHPQLGTLDDFRRLVAQARDFDMEVALDLALQCAPNHPWVQEHPQWFRHRPDGTIQYAENPPKKYQDIYPLDFETVDWRGLWDEIKRVVLFWIGQGVRIFRVDNPHTKPFAFWAWLIGEIKGQHPDVLFLSEAFTRPKVRYTLAKVGFTQSYTYFAWRNTKDELTHYLTELTRTEVKEYFRPNFWPNTPDILTEYLQHGGRPAFMIRLVLAATLAASYGIYGPAFELCIGQPREPGGEEYFNSEKYEVRRWDLEAPHSLRDFIRRVNDIRRENPALQSNEHLEFHHTDNSQILCYSKRTADLSNLVLTVVNLDPHHTQSGWVHLPLDQFHLDHHQPFQVHDLLGDARYLWQGPRNYVELNPHIVPAHVFRLRRRLRTERDFEYYL